jgi:hypothetical protein
MTALKSANAHGANVTTTMARFMRGFQWLQAERATTRYNGMTRATILRIVGFGFLVFAAVSIYNGEFAVGRSGELILTRAHDPQSFWRGIIMQIGAGCLALYMSRSAQRTIDDVARRAEAALERPKLPNYDPAFCGKVVNWLRASVLD